MNFLSDLFRDRKHEQIILRLNSILVELDDIKRKQKNMANTVTELEGKLETIETGLTDVGSKLDEGLGEVVAEIAKLREQLNTVQLPAGAQARLDSITAKTSALQTVAKTLADIVPNEPTP
jgi:chromosome segregation ATPase